MVSFGLKSSPLDVLGRVLRTVAVGRRYFCPETTGVLRELLCCPPGNGCDRMLSPRETEVL
jgi:DNA-binding NarL/FixJ family response regulator